MAAMRCLAEPDLDAYTGAVLPFLRLDPVLNNLAATIIESRSTGRAPVTPADRWLRVVDRDDTVLTVAVHTPPHPLLLTDGPGPAIDALADHLLADAETVSEVSGPEGAAQRFAQRWSTATGEPPRLTMRQRLFRLDAVTPPASVPGQLRPAGEPDRNLLIGWYDAFARDVDPESTPAESAPLVDRVLARGDALWLWQVADEPVTMVGIAPQVAGVARIAPVYTPPSLRGHGYGTAATAAVSQWALDQGATACMLYTDLANPTSNRIYQRIGYRPVADATQWRLRPAADSAAT
ncbi:GNAT family N-acetyltransferase [Natronosporangium hydrolyticum]|uniref:GNAT family N-acetyltransferase n=1 Tax=Natronosporangium hydrolyticum TaxID=2811111 RepID=A0A895YL81_9ACTN|nr:GNAT family N-acetyltransferase [Natronosporangium hydrolyticum]QSB16063.1 GNAT family N-acetyltransferase [Natronosporangium hydrolyticum]